MAEIRERLTAVAVAYNVTPSHFGQCGLRATAEAIANDVMAWPDGKLSPPLHRLPREWGESGRSRQKVYFNA